MVTSSWIWTWTVKVAEGARRHCLCLALRPPPLRHIRTPATIPMHVLGMDMVAGLASEMLQHRPSQVQVSTTLIHTHIQLFTPCLHQVPPLLTLRWSFLVPSPCRIKVSANVTSLSDDLL